MIIYVLWHGLSRRDSFALTIRPFAKEKFVQTFADFVDALASCSYCQTFCSARNYRRKACGADGLDYSSNSVLLSFPFNSFSIIFFSFLCFVRFLLLRYPFYLSLSPPSLLLFTSLFILYRRFHCNQGIRMRDHFIYDNIYIIFLISHRRRAYMNVNKNGRGTVSYVYYAHRLNIEAPKKNNNNISKIYIQRNDRKKVYLKWSMIVQRSTASTTKAITRKIIPLRRKRTYHNRARSCFFGWRYDPKCAQTHTATVCHRTC